MRAVEEDKPQRLFIGVPVPEKTSVAIARQLPPSIPGRQAPFENWHFTLRFLGNATSEQRARLIHQLTLATFGARFDLSFDKLGAFPNPRRAKVLWVGVGNGRERLESLAAKVEAAATIAGFEPETRRFSPHLTISRMRSPESVADVVEKSRSIDAHMLVDRVILYNSQIGGAHSRYAVVQTFPLS